MSSPEMNNFKPNQATIENITKGLTKLKYGEYQISKGISQAPTQYKMIIIVIGIIIVVILFYFLIYKKPLTLNHVTFLKGLMKSPPKPFDAKNTKFTYTAIDGNEDTYVSSNVLNIENQQQYTVSFYIYPRGSLIKSEENKGDWSYKYGQWKHILHIGHWDSNSSKTESQSPGFWLSPHMNRLNIMIDTTQEKERIILDNIDLNAWTNITLVVNDFSVGVYSNGRLEKTITLRYPPMKIFNNRLYVAENGGFAGFLAFIEVYSTPLEPDQVYKIYKYFLPWIEAWYDYEMDNRNVPVPTPFNPQPGPPQPP